MSRKCPQCGLVNWEHDETCKRCHAFLNVAAPPAFKWYVAYCILMALGYLALIVMGIVYIAVEPERDMSAAEQRIMGVVFIVMGLPFCATYAAAPFLPRSSWVWVFGLVLICIGLGSLCCLPICIPLLLSWIKPEMKAYYGRDLSPSQPPPPPQWS